MKIIQKTSKLLVTFSVIVLIFAFAGCQNQNQAPQPFTFVQLTDTQLGFGRSYEQDVNSFEIAVQRINELKPDFVVHCGDMVETFDEKSVKDYMDIQSGLNMPCYCCPGNHDITNEPTAAILNDYRSVFGDDYFSFNHKGYTFIITNTNIWRVPVPEESEKHDLWFKETINNAAGKNGPIFVVGHHPLYVRDVNEPDGNNPVPLEKRKEILELFEACGVVAYLSGHTHQLIINDYNGIQLVTAETTSRNFDRRPFGFRLWTVSAPDSISHEFVPLTEQTTDTVSPANNRTTR